MTRGILKGCGARGLYSLVRATGGNTLALMAAAMIPAAAIAGSAVDTARLYVVRNRLQQACDAGVLAGRRFMTSSDLTTLDGIATTQAQAFFRNNFRQGWMQTSAVGFTPSKTTDQQVAGTASAKVPMTVMKMFAAPDVTINIACEARFDVADADIMFVLDTTGSMACAPSDTNSDCAASANVRTYKRNDGSTGTYVLETSNAKIKALRTAVLNFYDTMNANKDPTTNLRYGFVPYSANVNVGRLIPSAMLYTGSDYAYPSRRLYGEDKDGDPKTVTLSGYTSATCATASGLRSPGSDPLVRAGWNTDSSAYRYSNAAWTNGRCAASEQKMKPVWLYEPIKYNLADFVAGKDVVNPTRLTGDKVEKWRGCIEERETQAVASFDINNLPLDLDPDKPGVSGDLATLWKPAYPDISWVRYSKASAAYAIDTINPSGASAPCGAEAWRLDVRSRSDIQNYLSASGDFRPNGGTYHDAGMIWGTRMISPDGIFKSDTAAWPGRNTPNRHIIFMTDGDMAPTTEAYSLYSIERSEQRVTGGTLSTQLARHNARFVAECRAARARNIEVWVIAFGTSLNQQMRDCATQDDKHIFFASDAASLDDAFARIARQVAMLRVSR